MCSICCKASVMNIKYIMSYLELMYISTKDAKLQLNGENMINSSIPMRQIYIIFKFLRYGRCSNSLNIDLILLRSVKIMNDTVKYGMGNQPEIMIQISHDKAYQSSKDNFNTGCSFLKTSLALRLVQ